MNGLGRNVQDFRNHYAFLKVLPKEQHRRLTGSWSGKPTYDPVRRIWYGATDWQKAYPMFGVSHAANVAEDSLPPFPRPPTAPVAKPFLWGLISSLLMGPPQSRIEHELEQLEPITLAEAQDRACAALRTFPQDYGGEDENDPVLEDRIQEVRSTTQSPGSTTSWGWTASGPTEPPPIRSAPGRRGA